ncbi:MAG: coproporphyrinogen dehydrogenase HemZ [Clostridiales bacterium]|nr:coproporphyrinogen dehydrogenase HemZ [Clostridiales bacterium]
MISVITQGHGSIFPAMDVSRLFFGPSVRCEGQSIFADYEEDIVIESIVQSDGFVMTTVPGTSIFEKSDDAQKLPSNRELKRQLYRVFSVITKKKFPWGSLTGIRPTLVAREVRDLDTLVRFYDVREDKAGLAYNTAVAEDRILSSTDDRDLFVYIGIPFCPGRCSYCSFITQESRTSSALLSEYKDTVLKEIAGLTGIMKNVRAVYFGGGTPTIMDDDLLRDFVCGALDLICPDRNAEITVEAGRPDTLTESKTTLLVDEGVGRICVNPQSLSDETLMRIGRHHTAEQFYRAFDIARKAGFSVINTDLIAGLPGESLDEFRFSIDRIIELNPENITVHALCKKRTSNLARAEIMDDPERVRIADQMVSYASVRLAETGYSPYYLYKQKDTVAGLENTGFSTMGTECVYNVAMMSDYRNVLAFGAGGVGKRVLPNGRIERHDCVRSVREYILRIDEIIRGKNRFFEV